MRYLVVLGIVGISFLSFHLQETEARTIPQLSIWLDEDTIMQNSFITADGGVPDITIQKGDVVSFPLTISPHDSESLPVNFFHSIESAIPDTRQSTLPDMKIELDPFHMVLKPDEPQLLNVIITTMNYTQLGEHKIKLTAQYPHGETLLNTRFDVLVISGNQHANYRFVDFTYANIKGDPIQFVLERTASGDCTSFQAEIINEDGDMVWAEGSFALCDPITNPSLITSQIKIGYNESNPIIIDEFGYYVLTVQIDDGSITKEFIVKPKSSVSIDRTVYPISFGISPLKQFQMGITIDKIKCKDTLLLIKKHDGTPVCVTPETKEKLIERGWTHIIHANLILHDTQQWGYIKDISILNNNYIGVTMSYPTNEAYHELYLGESNSIVGDCVVQNDSANLSVLYLNDIDSDADTITFAKEDKIFDGMSCDDAFWDEMTQHGYCGPPPHFMFQRETLVSSMTDAQSMVDFALYVPKYLPEGYDVQKIMADDDRKRATLFISPMPVTNETDMCAFTWNDGGIYLSYVSLPEDAPRFGNDPDREKITINGNRGYVKHQAISDRAGTPIPQGSEVTWHMPEGNLVLNMYSGLSSEKLIKIAESIG